MNNSAPDYSSRITSSQSAVSTQTPQLSPYALRACRRGAADRLRRIPVEATPLLAAQRLAFDSVAVLCVCENYRAAQKHFCEATAAFSETQHQPVLIHEMMPRYQQQYLLDCLGAMADYTVDCHPVVFISVKYYRQMLSDAPEIIADFRTVEIGNPIIDTNSAALDAAEPSISCICLRVGAGGRWVLMDHEEAAVASSTDAPSEALTRRLLNHIVQITGSRLAPYLAMMFDVPTAWKTRPELAQCALLVFRDDECPTGCCQPGIPPKILWNDVLGIICSD